MSVQFNLLPDVKLEYNKTKKQKRFIYGVSAIAVGVAATIFILSFLFVSILQKQLLSRADKDITASGKQLKSIHDIEKILTVQNQLSSLPKLHQQKHITSRLFTYLPQITPPNVSVGSLDLDTAATTMNFSGSADSIETVNKFVDTLKFTKYSTSDNPDNQLPAFSQVVLTAVGLSDKKASYSINTIYDAALFDATKTVKLTVPQTTTTRSVTESPAVTPLFNGQPTNEKKQGAQ